jgi:hypothetical protein
MSDSAQTSSVHEAAEPVMAPQDSGNQPSSIAADSELVTQVFLDQVPDADWTSGLGGFRGAGDLSDPMLRSVMTSVFGRVIPVGPAFTDQFLDFQVASNKYAGTKAEAELKFNENLVVGSSVVVSTSLSVGYVVWMLRGGSLMTAFMSSMPAWQSFDPLPIIDSFSIENHDDEDDSLASLIAD